MPRSLVLYTSNEVLFRLRERLTQGYGLEPIKPYTLSFAHRPEADSHRVRITELSSYSLSPIIDDLTGSGQALPVSTADKDVRGVSYEDLFESADRFQRTAVLQLLSPTIITLGGYHVAFPVLPLMLSQYVHVWNTFAEFKIAKAPQLLEHLKVADFKISCVQTEHGPACQGWIALELAKGRPEEEIQQFNALIDFAFYCGTGLHTDEGLGQTRRKP
ncbi:MAG: cas6 [Deltaproteobacteria bacterium]|nr:cas6 [Deltaproteobacteria bacterium]